MNEQLEIEFKVLLEKDIYQQIIIDNKDKIINEYTQTNYYLMHPLLDKLKYMLRIRVKDNQYELTLKRPSKEGNIETNIIISQDIKDNIFNHQTVNNEIFDILLKQGIDPLTLNTGYSLVTNRIDIKHPLGLISLDKNIYNNHCDYELEFEVLDYTAGKTAFLQFIKPYNISYSNNAPSKIKRLKLSL